MENQILVQVLRPALLFGFCGAGFAGLWFHLAKVSGGDAAAFLYSFIGGCTGLIVGTIYGATACLTRELAAAIRQERPEDGPGLIREPDDTPRRNAIRKAVTLEDRLGASGVLMLAAAAALITWLLMNFFMPNI